MSERKVLNKYFPPNFDPAKVPKRQTPKNAQHTVRLMAPFSMRCNTCGEYIYKGRKFNARKEPTGTNYLGIRIFRFYIRCPLCAAEITYKTDPANADYECELGAKRNFEPWREEKREEEHAALRRKLEETHNPMKALENKSYDAKRELDIAEALDEIQAMNSRLEKVDVDTIYDRVINESPLGGEEADGELGMGPLKGAGGRGDAARHQQQQEEQEEDDAIIREAFSRAQKSASASVTTCPLPTMGISTKDLLIGAGLSPYEGGDKEGERANNPLSPPSTQTFLGNSSRPKRKLDAASLGIRPKSKPAAPNG